MRIFKDLASDNNYDTIEGAVAAIIRRAEACSLGASPWSLAELRPDQEDFEWLCAWARQLQSGVARRCLEGGQWQIFSTEKGSCPRITAIGILLLFFFAEVARRKANERHLWSTVNRGYFTERTNAVLFIQGYPTHSHQVALERAARWLNLRHVFGIEGLQNWYDTVYLQFGFTEQGFKARLPEWLAGQGQTQAIQRLGEFNGPLHSTSFQTLWSALLNFRRSNITETQIKALLKRNPWILPTWIEGQDLLHQARARSYLGTATESSPPATDEKEELPFLSQPLLRWEPPQQPRFTSEIINLAKLDLTEQRYEIILAGQRCGSVQRQIDGSYQASPTELTLPSTQPEMVAALVTLHGEVIQSVILRLWDANEDITIFQAKPGKRIPDAWASTLRPASAYLLLLASDLTISPAPSFYYKLHPGATLYYLGQGWPSETTVFLAEEALWQPFLPASRVPSLSISPEDILVYPDERRSFSLGEQIRLLITPPAHVEIAFVRVGGKPIDFAQQTPGEIVTDLLTLHPSIFSSPMDCSLELTLGLKSVTTLAPLPPVKKKVKILVVGAAIFTEQGWSIVDTSTPLLSEKASRQPMTIFHYERFAWGITEDDRWIAELDAKPLTRLHLTGRGAPLILQRGEYNVLEPTVLLAHTVISRGCLAQIELEGKRRNRTLSVQLRQHIELEEGVHRLVWWDISGCIREIIPECGDIQDNAMWWLASVPPELTFPLALAISYEGKCLGSWWRDDWSEILHSLSGQDAATIAQMIRWLHLPLLETHALPAVQRFASMHPDTVLTSWMSDLPISISPPHAANQSVSLSWRVEDSDDSWLSVIRQVFRQWNAQAHTVQHLIATLSENNQNPPEALLLAAGQLLQVSPLLMGYVLKQWIEETGLPQWGKQLSRTLLENLQYTFAGASESEEFKQNERRLLEESVAKKENIDSAFVEKSLIWSAIQLFQGRTIQDRERRNLATALYKEPFRRLLSIHLLRFIQEHTIRR